MEFIGYTIGILLVGLVLYYRIFKKESASEAIDDAAKDVVAAAPVVANTITTAVPVVTKAVEEAIPAVEKLAEEVAVATEQVVEKVKRTRNKKAE
jgi:hypothetical protein